MKRVPRDTPIQLDLSKPVVINDSDDCHGKLFDPTTRACSICHDSLSCSIKMRDTNKSKTPNRKYLDEVELSNIPFNRLEKYVKKNSGKVTLQQIVDTIDDALEGRLDKETCIFQARNWIKECGFTLKGGVLYA